MVVWASLCFIGLLYVCTRMFFLKYHQDGLLQEMRGTHLNVHGLWPHSTQLWCISPNSSSCAAATWASTLNCDRVIQAHINIWQSSDVTYPNCRRYDHSGETADHSPTLQLQHGTFPMMLTGLKMTQTSSAMSAVGLCDANPLFLFSRCHFPWRRRQSTGFPFPGKYRGYQLSHYLWSQGKLFKHVINNDDAILLFAVGFILYKRQIQMSIGSTKAVYYIQKKRGNTTRNIRKTWLL